MQKDLTYDEKLEVLSHVISYSISNDEINKLKRTYIQKIRRLVKKYMDTKDVQVLSKIIELCNKYKDKSPFISLSWVDARYDIKSKHSYFSYNQVKYLDHICCSSDVDFFDNLIFLLREYKRVYDDSIWEKSRKEEQKKEINSHRSDKETIRTNEKSSGNVKSGIGTVFKDFISIVTSKGEEDKKNKSDTGVNDINRIAILVKQLMSIIKSKNGEYIINDVPDIPDKLKELIKDLIELQQFQKLFKNDDTIISRKYKILSNRIYQYLYLKANCKLTEEEQIMLILLEKNNILGLLEKNKQYHGAHHFIELIPNINKKIVCDLDKLFNYSNNLGSGPRMMFNPERGWDFKTSLWSLTYLMPINEIKRLYDKYRVAFYGDANTQLNHGCLQTIFCLAIKNNKFYKSFFKNNATEKEEEAENLFICATFLDTMPIFINSKEELYEKILTAIKNKKISAAMCQILNDKRELNVIDIPSVNKKIN